MLRTNIFASVTLLLWVLALWAGVSLIVGVVNQNVPGYPNPGQMIHYMFLPGGIVFILASSIAYFNFVRRSPTMLAGVSTLFLLCLPVFISLSGGGA
jgi:hypothetical protein